MIVTISLAVLKTHINDRVRIMAGKWDYRWMQSRNEMDRRTDGRTDRRFGRTNLSRDCFLAFQFGLKFGVEFSKTP